MGNAPISSEIYTVVKWKIQQLPVLFKVGKVIIVNENL